MNHKKRQRIFERKIMVEYERVFNFIYSRVDHDLELARDITQDTMERIWDRLDQLENKESPRGWIMQIAVNEIRKYFRAQNARKRGAFQEESYELHEFEELNNPEAAEADVLDLIVAQEERSLLIKALEQVKEPYQVILDLRLIQDLKFSRIAEIMQMDEAITRVYFQRGVKMLKKEYEKLAEGGAAHDGQEE